MSRHTMKKDYLLFVTVTFIILLTYIRRSACRTRLLLAHNPRCGYNIETFLSMTNTTPFLFDRSENGNLHVKWKDFMEQNHSYVDPAYLPEQWNLDPPEEVSMRFSTYYDDMDGSYAVVTSLLTLKFNSTGKASTEWPYDATVLSSIRSPVRLTFTYQANSLMIIPEDGLVNWVMSDIRADENNQMVLLVIKPNLDGHEVITSDEEAWSKSRDRVVIGSLNMTSNDSDLVIYPDQCLAGIDVSYENLTSGQSATVTLDIFINQKTHMWTRNFTSNQTRHRIDFQSAVCPENITVLSSAGQMSGINIQLLASAGHYNRAYFLRVYGYYKDEVQQPVATMESQEQASPTSPPGTTSNYPTTTPVHVTTTNPPTTTPVHVTTTNPSTTTPVHVTTPEPVTVSGITSEPLTCVNSNWNTEVNSSALPALLKEIAELKQQLAVNKSQLTSTIRRKISVPDKRVSSQVLGYAAGLILGVLVVFLVVSDLPAIVKTLKILKKNVFGK